MTKGRSPNKFWEARNARQTILVTSWVNHVGATCNTPGSCILHLPSCLFSSKPRCWTLECIITCHQIHQKYAQLWVNLFTQFWYLPIAFIDADYRGYRDTQCSTSGYVLWWLEGQSLGAVNQYFTLPHTFQQFLAFRPNSDHSYQIPSKFLPDSYQILTIPSKFRPNSDHSYQIPTILTKFQVNSNQIPSKFQPNSE